MCGIAGIIDFRSGFLTADLQAISVSLHHRGPDDEGYYLADDGRADHYRGDDTDPALRDTLAPLTDSRHRGIGLMHRRLSILDLSTAGHQPMVDEASGLVMVFNGEIYNYQEIAETHGYDCMSGSDSEVVLKHFAEKGVAAVRDFRGMWALAIHDRRNKKLILSRDRFGIKPLYHSLKGSRLAFASEIKALFEVEGIEPRVNKETLAQFVNYGTYKDDFEVPFEGVEALPPAHNLIIDLSTDSLPHRIERYYSPTPKEGATIADFHDRFRMSIALHMRADVEVGSCLSGGLDSSAIVMEAAKLNADRFHTFTAAYRDPAIDESDYARMLKPALPQLEQHFNYPDAQGLMADWDKMIWHQDLPVGSSSIYAQWTVMQSAKEQGIKVLLDGQGADELLGGYYNFAGLFVIEKLKKLQLMGAAKAYASLKKNFTPAMRSALMRAAFAYVPDGLKNSARQGQRLGASLLTEEMRSYLPSTSAPHRNGRSMQEHSLLSLRQGMYELLRYEDRNSMAFSIESRVPFLDHELVDTVLGLPSEQLIHDGWTKWPVRQLLNKKLPDPLVWRKDKKGFLTPQQAWKDELLPVMKEKVMEADHGIFDRQQLVEQLERAGLSNSELSELWRVYAVGRWMEVIGVRVA